MYQNFTSINLLKIAIIWLIFTLSGCVGMLCPDELVINKIITNSVKLNTAEANNTKYWNKTDKTGGNHIAIKFFNHNKVKDASEIIELKGSVNSGHTGFWLVIGTKSEETEVELDSSTAFYQINNGKKNILRSTRKKPVIFKYNQYRHSSYFESGKDKEHNGSDTLKDGDTYRIYFPFNIDNIPSNIDITMTIQTGLKKGSCGF